MGLRPPITICEEADRTGVYRINADISFPFRSTVREAHDCLAAAGVSVSAIEPTNGGADPCWEFAIYVSKEHPSSFYVLHYCDKFQRGATKWKLCEVKLVAPAERLKPRCDDDEITFRVGGT